MLHFMEKTMNTKDIKNMLIEMKFFIRSIIFIFFHKQKITCETKETSNIFVILLSHRSSI